MGSDFLVSFVTIGKKKKPDFAAARRRIERLAAMPHDKLPSEYLNTIGLPDEEEFTNEERDRRIKQLREDLGGIEAEFGDDNFEMPWRDLTSFNVDRKRVVLAGGMSGGDAPSDAFSSLERLVAAGVTKAAGFDW
jgi:hypothetical protein